MVTLLDADALRTGVGGFYARNQGLTAPQVWNLAILGLWLRQWKPYLQ